MSVSCSSGQQRPCGGCLLGKSDYEKRVIRFLNELILAFILGEIVVLVVDLIFQIEELTPIQSIPNIILMALVFVVNHYGYSKVTKFVFAWLIPILSLTSHFFSSSPPPYHFMILIDTPSQI